MSDSFDSGKSSSIPEYDVLIIGAGVAGLYQLYRLLAIGTRVVAVDALSDLGGTWYQNRYPGCRFDSESYTYAYSFSDELLQEWDWSERFTGRPENLRYLNYVADKFGLRPHIKFNTRVERPYSTKTTQCGGFTSTMVVLRRVGSL